MPEQPQQQRYSRRGAIALFGAVAAGAGLAAAEKRLRVLPTLPGEPLAQDHISATELARVEEFKLELPEPQPLPQAKLTFIDEAGISQERPYEVRDLESDILTAIAESQESGAEVTIELPHGEITVSKQVLAQIGDARIRIKGNSAGTRLKLTEEMSQIPTAWAGPIDKNIFRFQDIAGSVDLEGIEFHGGSPRAGKGGYVPPESPWNALVFCEGRGKEEATGLVHGFEKEEGGRDGAVQIKDCHFFDTESAAFVIMNVREGKVLHSSAKRTDGSVICFSDQGTFDHFQAQDTLSDGIAMYRVGSPNKASSGGGVSNSRIDTARQGIFLSGCVGMKVDNNIVGRALQGYVVNEGPEGDSHGSYADGTPFSVPNQWSSELSFNDCDSSECAMPFAVERTINMNVQGGLHTGIGQWHTKRGFMYQGIANYADTARYTYAIHLGLADNVGFENTKMILGDHAKATGYGKDNSPVGVPGVQFYRR